MVNCNGMGEYVDGDRRKVDFIDELASKYEYMPSVEIVCADSTCTSGTSAAYRGINRWRFP